MSALSWLGVALCGGLGALLRYAVDGAISAAGRGGLPLGTFVINISGALVLGLLSGMALSGSVSLLLGVALIGSYTTFSTWMLESMQLHERGEGFKALGNVVISLAVGLGAVAVGHLIGGLL